LLVFH